MTAYQHAKIKLRIFFQEDLTGFAKDAWSWAKWIAKVLFRGFRNALWGEERRRP